MAARVPTFVHWKQADEPMTPKQEKFYGTFREAVLAGEPLDVGDSDGYGKMLVAECIANFDSDQELALDIVGKLRAAYPRSYLGARHAEADMRLLRGEWSAGYELSPFREQLGMVLGMADELVHPRLDPVQFWRFGRSNITKSGFSILDTVLDELERELDEFHDAHGINLVEHYWGLIHRPELPAEEVAESIRHLVGKHLDHEDIVYSIELGRNRLFVVTLTAFRGHPEHERPIATPRLLPAGDTYGRAWDDFIRHFVRGAENRARAIAKLPGVGKGLVSETKLLNQLREAFPDETIHHQVRPSWLGRQSLDMVFADRNVAIEYQGTQHSRPVDFFGGEDTFVMQKQRDLDKRILCEENGMTLLEVHPGYVLGDVVTLVRKALDASETRTS